MVCRSCWLWRPADCCLASVPWNQVMILINLFEDQGLQISDFRHSFLSTVSLPERGLDNEGLINLVPILFLWIDFFNLSF